MKLINKIIFAVILSLLISCSDNSTNTTDPETNNNAEEISKFFPIEIGKSFIYKVDTLDNNSENYVEIGQRTLHVDKIESDYFVCSEIYNFLHGINLQTKIKVTDNSVEIFSDTTGTSDLIPDSLGITVKLELDEVFKVLDFPLVQNKEWEVYKAYAVMGTARFKVFALTAKYLGEENILLNNKSEQVPSIKIEYTVTINIPDMNNLLNSKIQNYKANVWLSENLGIVKLEGCALFVNSITGNNFDMSDSNKTIKHTLVL
ncbi:MAG: hypothetical protein IPM32_01805 [Ignavibacteriae bacterium]|nr:hypothetical protein [Ignavibacteriota bacterium]